jgi:hypothetical protein
MHKLTMEFILDDFVQYPTSQKKLQGTKYHLNYSKCHSLALVYNLSGSACLQDFGTGD